MPFNEKNLKALFDKRMNDNVTFVVKQESDVTVHSVQDATGIASKTFELFKKDFDYLYNADYISATQKSELRQQPWATNNITFQFSQLFQKEFVSGFRAPIS